MKYGLLNDSATYTLVKKAARGRKTKSNPVHDAAVTGAMVKGLFWGLTSLVGLVVSVVLVAAVWLTTDIWSAIFVYLMVATTVSVVNVVRNL